MAAPVVRRATIDDAATIHRFCLALATFEGEPEMVASTPETMARDGFGADAKFRTLIAELDGVAVGFATYDLGYSTWEARRSLFVQDIWVEPGVRRRGVARALLGALARACREHGGGRIDLHVRHSNPARRFYEALGFRAVDKLVPYRLRGEDLARLAAAV